MKNKFFLMYAFRCLGIGKKGEPSNARKSLLGAVLGIGISIIPLIVILVLSDGMINGITKRMVELGTGQIKVVKRQVIENQDDARHEKVLKIKLLEKYKSDPYFTNAWIEREGSGLIIGKAGRSGGTIRAVEPSFFEENIEARKLIQVIEGELILKDNKTIFLGKKIAENLGLKVGDTCRLLTLNSRSIPKMSIFKVGAIISSGYQELDALWAFIPLEKGLQIFPVTSSLTSLIVSVNDVFDESKFRPFVYDLKNTCTSDFSIYTWDNLNRAQFVSFKTTKNILVFVMFLIILVASTNIASALVMLVLERSKEIAILKSIGASGSSITLSFLLAGLLTSFGGICIGVPIGLLLAININEIFKFVEVILNYILSFIYNLFNYSDFFMHIKILDPAYYLEHITVSLKLSDVFFVVAGVLILSIVVCIMPAIQAGKEKPIEIMRKL